MGRVMDARGDDNRSDDRNSPEFPPTARMQAVQSPVIPVVAELTRTPPGTISRGQGVVSSAPPPQAAEQIQTFFQDPDNHKYRPVHGIPPLLEEIEQKL